MNLGTTRDVEARAYMPLQGKGDCPAAIETNVRDILVMVEKTLAGVVGRMENARQAVRQTPEKCGVMPNEASVCDLYSLVLSIQHKADIANTLTNLLCDKIGI
jgi:hypothetical protein